MAPGPPRKKKTDPPLTPMTLQALETYRNLLTIPRGQMFKGKDGYPTIPFTDLTEMLQWRIKEDSDSEKDDLGKNIQYRMKKPLKRKKKEDFKKQKKKTVGNGKVVIDPLTHNTRERKGIPEEEVLKTVEDLGVCCIANKAKIDEQGQLIVSEQSKKTKEIRLFFGLNERKLTWAPLILEARHTKQLVSAIFCCSDCEHITCDQKVDFAHQMSRHTKLGEEQYACDNCSFMSRGLHNLRRHERACLKIKLSSYGLKKRTMMECPYCEHLTYDRKVALAHRRSVHAVYEPFRCHYCNYFSNSFDNMREHRQVGLCGMEVDDEVDDSGDPGCSKS